MAGILRRELQLSSKKRVEEWNDAGAKGKDEQEDEKSKGLLVLLVLLVLLLLL